MKNRESHPIRNGIIAAVVAGALLSFWEPFKVVIIDIFIWLWSLVELVWEWISSPHEVYGWLLILLVSLATSTLIHLFLKVIEKNDDSPEKHYTSDFIFGAEWQWSYTGGAIYRLWCLCPLCKSELIYSEFKPDRYDFTHDNLNARTDFSCQNCNMKRSSIDGNKRFALETVEREIRRRIRNNEWRPSKAEN